MYVEIKNLSKSFGPKTVVENLNLSLEKGKILCLLGASGCGKTTTLRMIGGFLKEDGGSILVDGADIAGLPPEKRPVSTVFQSYALFPHKTVLENVIYGLKFQGIKRREAVEQGMEYLKIVGLSDYAGAKIHEISGGQQQRVALARALIVKPKVLLLDEPLSNLDAKLRIRMRDEIKELQQKFGMTMIFVTHDQEEAMVLADSIAIMDQGRLVQVGTPQAVYNHPADAFVMNFLGTSSRVALSDGREIYVRPEAVRIRGIEGEGVFAGSEEQEGAETLRGTVVKAEYLGFYYLYEVEAEADGRVLTVRCGLDMPLSAGQRVELSVDVGKALL